MLSKFKLYLVFIITLIFSQLVMAAGTFINFHNEMRNYEETTEKEQVRNPTQIENKIHRVKIENPIMEIKDEKQKEDNLNKSNM